MHTCTTQLQTNYAPKRWRGDGVGLGSHRTQATSSQTIAESFLLMMEREGKGTTPSWYSPTAAYVWETGSGRQIGHRIRTTLPKEKSWKIFGMIEGEGKASRSRDPTILPKQQLGNILVSLLCPGHFPQPRPLPAESTSSPSEGWTWMEHNKKFPLQPHLYLDAGQCKVYHLSFTSPLVFHYF
jgi:hypothetical protein